MATPQKPVTPPKILIVDDEVNLCHLLKDTLEAYDYEATYAEDGETALKLTEEFKPTVALMDYRLGDLDGIEVAKSLKKIDDNLPVILMTAYPSLDLAVKAIQSDIYDFLPKPVDKTYLLRSISKAIEKRTLTEENRRLIEHLKESNASLDKLNQVKSKFLSIVTHDLRTPLTSMRGYSEILRDEANLSPTERQKCFGSVERAIERMNGLIGNLMDLVSIEAGKLRVEKMPLDYIGICEEMKATLLPIANSKKISMDWKLAPSPVMVSADPQRLVQVMTNLTSNAFKHTPESGKVTVRVSVKDGKVLTEVIDNGAGIPAQETDRIFEQFYQVESSKAKRQGLGLGLMISKEIVVAHQGEIGVSSDGPGKGSRFWFSIPQEKKS